MKIWTNSFCLSMSKSLSQRISTERMKKGLPRCSLCDQHNVRVLWDKPSDADEWCRRVGGSSLLIVAAELYEYHLVSDNGAHHLHIN